MPVSIIPTVASYGRPTMHHRKGEGHLEGTGCRGLAKSQHAAVKKAMLAVTYRQNLGRVLVLTYRLVITKFVYHATVSRENSTCKSNIRLVAIFVFILWRPCLRRCLRYLKRSFGSLRSSRCDKKLFEAGVTASETPPQLPCKLPKLCLR